MAILFYNAPDLWTFFPFLDSGNELVDRFSFFPVDNGATRILCGCVLMLCLSAPRSSLFLLPLIRLWSRMSRLFFFYYGFSSQMYGQRMRSSQQPGGAGWEPRIHTLPPAREPLAVSLRFIDRRTGGRDRSGLRGMRRKGGR